MRLASEKVNDPPLSRSLFGRVEKKFRVQTPVPDRYAGTIPHEGVSGHPSPPTRDRSFGCSAGTVLVSPPAFSPDGTQIAFAAGPAEGASEFDLYVAPSGGGAPRKLTQGGAWNLSPAWSPDGKWLVYSSKREAGADPWAVLAAGGEPVRLLETPEDESDPVAWGAGLRWVAAIPSTSDVYLYELGSSGRPSMLAETPTEERAGATSGRIPRRMESSPSTANAATCTSGRSRSRSRPSPWCPPRTWS